MRSKMFIHIILVIEAVLIIIQLVTKHEAWIGMTCFWSIVALDNLCDVIEEKWSRRDKNTET